MKYLNRGRPPSPPVDTSTPNSQPLRRIGGTHRLDQDSPGGGSIQRVIFCARFQSVSIIAHSAVFKFGGLLRLLNINLIKQDKPIS